MMTGRTVEICTTYNKAYYKLCAKEMIESFIKYWPKECILHAYWQEQEPEIIQDNIVYHELYKVQPQLKEFVDKWKDEPTKNGWREDRQKYIWKNDGVKFSHKVFTQTHRIKNSTADVILYSDADTLYTAKPNLDYLREICPEDSLCTFFDRNHLRDETGFYMHNPKHPKAKEWANRLEEIYITGELWNWTGIWANRQADQYTMARGRESFKYCKQMDLIQYHTGLHNHNPIPTSPLAKFLTHMKGSSKLKGQPKSVAGPSVFPVMTAQSKENK